MAPQVGLDARLRRAAVVGAQGEDPGDIALGRLDREMHVVGGVVAGRPGDDGDRHGAGDGLPQLQLLVVAQRRRLSRRAADDEAFVAFGLQPLGELDCTVDVEREIVVERRDHRRHDPAESSHSSRLITPAWAPGVLRRTYFFAHIRMRLKG